MKVFITGATGYIGEQLALALLARGVEVVALVRSPEKAAALVAAGAKLIQGDLEDRAAISQGMEHCEAVCHLAAYARIWPEDEALFRKVNVEGTRTMLEAAKAAKVRRFILMSTTGIYGPSAPGSVVTEDTNRTVPYFTPYEKTKAGAEALAKAFAANGLEVIVLCPARVYGPGRQSESSGVNKLIRLYLAGKWRFIPAQDAGTGSYCYIGDVVEACIRALHEGRSGESYLLGGENVTYREFFALLRQLTGKHYKLYPVPGELLVFLSRIAVLVARLLHVRPLLTPGWAKKYLYDWRVSSRKAEGALRYSITPLETGLQKTLDFICHGHNN